MMIPQDATEHLDADDEKYKTVQSTTHNFYVFYFNSNQLLFFWGFGVLGFWGFGLLVSWGFFR